MVSSDKSTDSDQELVPIHTARKPHTNTMQSTRKEGAIPKTSKSKMDSPPEEDPPHPVIVTNNDGNCNIVEVNHKDYDIITQNHPSKRTNTLGASSEIKTVDTNPQTTRRKYAGTITGIKFFPEQQQIPTTFEEHHLREDTRSKTKTEIPWTPKQFYDVKGNPDYHMNSDGIVLTSPSGHPYCSYCRIPSHSRRSCNIRIKDLARNIPP